jgi:hypothetical protein
LRGDKGDQLRNVFLELLADGEPAVIISLRVAAIASVMAAVACTPVMAQTTGTIPPQSPPPEVTPSSPPPTASQFSSNELINAGSHFFGGVSHGLAMIVEKAHLPQTKLLWSQFESGIGLRLGANLGYLKFTDSPTWNPF